MAFNHSTSMEQEESQDDEVEHREMVNAFASKVVADLRNQVADLHQTIIAWLANAPNRILPAVQGWNGPFIDYLCLKSGQPNLLCDSFTPLPHDWTHPCLRYHRQDKTQGRYVTPDCRRIMVEKENK